MFCSACGRPAIGNFCTACGKPLAPRATVPAPHFQAAAQMVRTVAPVLETVEHAATEPVGEVIEAPQPRRTATLPALPARRMADLAVTFLPNDEPQPWDDEVNYRTLVKTPEVRELIDRYASLARKKMTGEELLQLADKIMPTGVPLDKVASLFQPLAEQMGINTGKERVERIVAPVGRVLVRLLCSLARHGQSLRHVRQGSDGCALEATLPSDIWALEGQLGITVVRRGGWTDVGAATKLGGQWFDWGKSRRCLDQLFADLQQDPY
ncbi:MAG: hypothetical protein AB7U73_21025 [Pirellulales bacterium]